MECTQRLECTQDLYETHTERVCPEQIGFLGICGAKHPVLRGPNKIGRDPQTCSIVLNLNSISRQHAVINVLNSKEFMLMDLDSANKTKLQNKTLQAYIPHPITNGDTVQFGDIFGIFRLLEEDDELPMTQALDIPETPVPSKHISKLTKVPTTMIPESPDVSDKDDSFATPQQSRIERTKLSSGQFINPFGKPLSIQPISSPKTDISRNSSKKSISFVDNANTSLNDSLISLKVHKYVENADDIHEMDTQAPSPIAKPSVNESTDSIYMADTQIPPGHGVSPSIHSLDTQIPTAEHLPLVCKINNQKEMQFDIYAANKENDISIFNAETQPFVFEKDKSVKEKDKSPDISTKSLNKSEEEVLFDEIEDDCFEYLNSQPLLPQDSPKHVTKLQEEPMVPPKANTVTKLKSPKPNAVIESDDSTDCEDIDIAPTQKIESLPVKNEPAKVENHVKSDALKRTNRVGSGDSTDCEDIEIMATQKIAELPITNDKSPDMNIDKNDAAKRVNRIQSDASTDCEDVDLIPTQKIPEKGTNKDEDLTDCEDELVEVILPKSKSVKEQSTKFEDMPTQVIDIDPNKLSKPALEDMDTQIIDVDENIALPLNKDNSFEDQATQIIEEITPAQVVNKDQNKIAFEDMNTQIIGVDENFATTSNKVNNFEDQPTQIISETIQNKAQAAKKSFEKMVSPFKIPLQSPIRVKNKEIPKVVAKEKTIETISIDDENYYNATQDILDDLCSQREGSPILRQAAGKLKSASKSPVIIDDDIVPCSVEGYKVGDKFANIDNELSPSRSGKIESAKKYATNLPSQEERDVIGVEGSVDKLKRLPSDSSDIECTPKKVRKLIFTDSDLPNSQEIKTSMLINNHAKSYATESSSESETEQNDDEQNTPFLHRKKKSNPTSKIDLTKKFDVEKLPERIITRVRKPTTKMEESLQNDKKTYKNILKPKFLTEQEDQIDQEIITENVKRLKTYEKAKANKETKNENKISPPKTEDEKHTNESKIREDISKPGDSKTVDVVEIKRTETKTESVTQVKAENKTKEAKEKIKVKIEKPKKKETDRESKSKKKEDTSSRKSKEEPNDRKSKERTSAAKSKEDTSRKSENDKTKPKEDSLHSTSDTKITRSTRSRRKGHETKVAEKKSVSPDANNKEPVETKRKRPVRRKEQPKESVSPEVEIRRSKRQAKVKEDKKSDSQNNQTMPAPKSILKKSMHEQSTVYNISSGGESPKNLKRSLGDDSEVPSPKRTRGYVNNVNSSINNASLRATPARTMKTQRVLFTAFPSDEVKLKLEKLGAEIVTDVMQCTVVLTMAIKRTFKLLCAVGLGHPIVGPGWVQACVDTHMIVDPWLYLVKDESAERRFQFNLERTLSGKRNFLKGYNVSSTPSVQPNASEMKLIVECSGGIWKEGGSNWVCVSSSKDSSLWPALRKRGATIVSTEFILGGVLRQKIEIASNKFP